MDDDDGNGVWVGGKGGSGTERTLSVRAAEDPLSDISGSRACAIEVASTTRCSTKRTSERAYYVHTLKGIKV
jgi:hypothetical protein